MELISEGTILKQNLEQIGRDEKWLAGGIKKRGLRLEQVALEFRTKAGFTWIYIKMKELILLMPAIMRDPVKNGGLL